MEPRSLILSAKRGVNGVFMDALWIHTWHTHLGKDGIIALGSN